MRRLLRAEVLKLRTSRLTVSLTAALVALLMLVVLVHGFALREETLNRGGQRHVFGLTGLGAVFAALLGVMSLTSELRSGTIRPTFLTSPRRQQVLVAKALTVAACGAGYGLLAAGLTLGLGSLALTVRGIPLALTGEDYAQIVTGSATGAMLWAVLAFGVAGVVRHQVAATVAVAAWMLFVEPVLLSQIPAVVRFFPGSAAAAISGSTIGGEVPASPGLLAPALGVLLLIAYAAACATAGVTATERRDVP